MLTTLVSTLEDRSNRTDAIASINSRLALNSADKSPAEPTISQVTKRGNANRLVSPQCILDRLQHWPQLSTVGIRLDEIDHPPQDRPLVGIEVARGPLLDADKDVARQQAVSDLRQLGPWCSQLRRPMPAG